VGAGLFRAVIGDGLQGELLRLTGELDHPAEARRPVGSAPVGEAERQCPEADRRPLTDLVADQRKAREVDDEAVGEGDPRADARPFGPMRDADLLDADLRQLGEPEPADVREQGLEGLEEIHARPGLRREPVRPRVAISVQRQGELVDRFHTSRTLSGPRRAVNSGKPER
jgi:hypothetical protein